MGLRHFFKHSKDFDNNYAGPCTRELEQAAIRFAGRQDSFCIICGKHKTDLYPKKLWKEIHYCPRRYCLDCVKMHPNWKENPFTDDDKVDHYRYTQSCPLCYKRGWIYINPITGPDNPNFSTMSESMRHDLRELRHNDWEYIIQCDSSLKVLFETFRDFQDDGSILSDRLLLEKLKPSILKSGVRFATFPNTGVPFRALGVKVPEAHDTLTESQLRIVFQDECHWLLDIVNQQQSRGNIKLESGELPFGRYQCDTEISVGEAAGISDGQARYRDRDSEGCHTPSSGATDNSINNGPEFEIAESETNRITAVGSAYSIPASAPNRSIKRAMFNGRDSSQPADSNLVESDDGLEGNGLLADVSTQNHISYESTEPFDKEQNARDLLQQNTAELGVSLALTGVAMLCYSLSEGSSRRNAEHFD